jgi:hypothetical protein
MPVGLRAATTALLAATVLFVPSGAAAGGALHVVALTPPPGLPAGELLSEPHIAVDPVHPSRLVAVAQTFHGLVVWRSADGGSSWHGPVTLRGSRRGTGYGSGDPVATIDREGSVLAAGVTFDRRGRCTLLERVGSYRSGDGGAEFARLASTGPTVALPRHFFGVPPLPQCPIPPGLDHMTTLDKPWIAAGATRATAGSVYLSWTRFDQFLDGRTFATLYLSVSRDGGKSYRPPVVVSPRAAPPGSLEQYSQVGVRPDGTVDVIWNGLWNGRPGVLHRSSADGRTFGPAEPVTLLPKGATTDGLATSLAISPAGRLGVCWSASALAAYRPKVACSTSWGDGTWTRPVFPFTSYGLQYLPAAAFEGERLWVAAYRSVAGTTRVLLAGSTGRGAFAEPVVLARRPYGLRELCGTRPPDCYPSQRFVGDYIGAAASRDTVWVDFVLPQGAPESPNRVYVAKLAAGP